MEIVEKWPLSEVQTTLWRLITAPEGVLQTLEASPTELPLKSTPPLSGKERLDIYANMYFYRILDSLKEDFQAVHKALGDIPFHNLITEYLVFHPPTHYSLRYVGQDLPGFMAKKIGLEPYLSELAHYEYLLLEAFDAMDAPFVTEEQLKEVPQDQWPNLVFETHPSLNCLETNWNLIKIREELLGDGPLETEQEQNWIRIWRKDYHVFSKKCSKMEKEMIQGITEKKNFGTMCENLTHSSHPDSPQKILFILGDWLKEGLLSSYVLS